jgi:hypothetical protein
MTLLRQEASQGAALPQLTLPEILRLDLLARGLPAPPLGECEAIVARLLERMQAADDAPPRRCETSEVDLDGSCMACGAIQGEACLRPEGRQ